MKHVRKALAFVVALVMALAVVTPAIAQTKDSQKGGNASITIKNAAKDETYSVYKLFDATVSATTTNGESDSIAYTGDIPSGLESYFEKDTKGNIKVKDAAKKQGDPKSLSDDAIAALTTWVNSQQTPTATEVSDGSTLQFTNLQYGYYVVTTTQGTIPAITVDSTNPNATIIDKNTTNPLTDGATKTVDKDDVNVGDTVTYTAKTGTANFNEGTKRITKYVVEDNFANGALTDINVTSIKVGDQEILKKQDGTFAQFENGKIEIPWSDANGSLYNNGAELSITYTAKVAKEATVGATGNTNTVKFSFVDEKGGTGSKQKQVTIYTYGIAIKKVDNTGKALAGAKFKFPFKTKNDNGVYVYDGAGTSEIVTPANGIIVVKGVKSGEYSVEETEAPNGFNKLANPVKVTASKTGSTTYYYDGEGNLKDTQTEGGFSVEAVSVEVVNQKGTEIPSTGGIGTTIFYIVGGVMVAGAAIFLLTKRRVNAE